MQSASREGDDAARKRAKKRQRVQYSCTECFRRKQKCNRETPCQNCVARKADHLCVEHRPGYDSLDTDARILRLEVALDRGLERIFSSLQDLRRDEGREPSREVRSSPESVRNTSSTHSHVPVMGGPEEPAGFDPLAVTLPFDSANSTYAFLRSHLFPGSKGENRHVEGKAQPKQYSFTIGQLPQQSRCKGLLDLFCGTLNVLYLPLTTSRIRPNMDALLTRESSIKEEDLHLFSILASILSLSITSAPNELLLDGPASRLEEARTLRRTAQLALLTSESTQGPDMDRVTAWALLSRVLHVDEEASDAWEAATRAVTSAFTIGLHQEPRMALMRPDEEQERRRVWAMIYIQERSLSVALNRPSTIRDELCTTKAPDESQWQGERIAATLSPLSHMIHLFRLATLMGRVNTIVQCTDGNTLFREAVEVDAEICSLRDQLPPFFRFKVDEEDAKDDVDATFFHPGGAEDVLSLHRISVATEIDALRIALYRPYLSPSSVGSRESRAASIEASFQSMARRAAVVKTVKREYPAQRVPRWHAIINHQSQRFNAVLACSVSLLLNPRDGEAPKLRKLVEAYLANMPQRTWQSLQDANVRRAKSFEREYKVLQLFLDRVDRLSASASQNNESTTTAATPTTGLIDNSGGFIDSHRLSGTHLPLEASWPSSVGSWAQPSDGLQTDTMAALELDPFWEYLTKSYTDEAQVQESLMEALSSSAWPME